MSDYEKPGSFYLGREYDLATGQTRDEKLLYDADDLTTHAVCVGMTGSGKTGLCLSLIEEAALDGIPVIAIDPKGDLGNLLLAFPQLEPADFREWVDPDEARQKNLTIEQLADQTAARWRKGLAEWDQSGERIARMNSTVDKVIYTPGSTAGVPLTVLKGFHAPPEQVRSDADTYNDLVQSTTQGVLALVGIDADPVKSREAILLANILSHAWQAGEDLDLPRLIREIQRPPFDKVGIVDVESFLPAQDRFELGMKINSLLASPSFAGWLNGEALDVAQLLYAPNGKPRLAILSIAHLNDAERMFFVTILLNEVLSWTRSQPGTSTLRAILYMDEVFGYFPPTANPPSKRPMLTLLKQARAYGLGVMLATQNPVDLDYKGLSNAGTWFLGRLQTERDKLRVLEGLEGVSAQAGEAFNRQEMDTILSSLASRVFLVNNVHQSGPRVMHTRWAMSYLRGPLTREQIRTLMKDRKSDPPEAATIPAAPRTESQPHGAQPMLPGNIPQKFWPPAGESAADGLLEYRPALLSEAKVHFVQAASQTDVWRDYIVLKLIDGRLTDPIWADALTFDQIRPLADSPAPAARFSDWPAGLAQPRNYRDWERDLKDWVYRNQRYERLYCSLTDTHSEDGETEDEFRTRVAPTALVAAKQRINQEFDKELKKIDDKIGKAQDQVAKHKWWWFNSVWRVIEVLLIRLAGGRSRKQIVTQTSSQQMSRGRRAYSEAREELKSLERQRTLLVINRDNQLAALDRDYSAEAIALEKTTISPRKSDVSVGPVKLVWLPWQVDASGRAERLY